MRQPVEGANPHPPHIGASDFFNPLAHLSRGFIGKRQRQNIEWFSPFVQQISHSESEHPRFAGSCTRNDHHRPIGLHRRFFLGRV